MAVTDRARGQTGRQLALHEVVQVSLGQFCKGHATELGLNVLRDQPFIARNRRIFPALARKRRQPGLQECAERVPWDRDSTSGLLLPERGRELVLNCFARTGDELLTDAPALAVLYLVPEGQQCDPSAGLLLENAAFILS